MKLLAIVLTLMLSGVYGFAQEQAVDAEKQQDVQEVTSTVSDQKDHKKEIQKEELPEQVMVAFDSSVYKEWSIEKVFMIKGESETSYELHLTLQDQEMVLLADTEGNLQPKADS